MPPVQFLSQELQLKYLYTARKYMYPEGINVLKYFLCRGYDLASKGKCVRGGGRRVIKSALPFVLHDPDCSHDS